MKKFDDKIPARQFDNFQVPLLPLALFFVFSLNGTNHLLITTSIFNFQFVNFTEIMTKHTSTSEKETAFALAALMEIPLQYKAAREFGLLGYVLFL